MSFKSIGITSSIAFVLLLAGCGGSGSDIKVIPSPKPTPDIPSPNPKPGNNVYRSMSSYNSTKHTSDGSVSNNAPSFDTLTFNGRELPLVVENIKNGRIVALDRGVKLGGVSYKKFYVGTTRQANARFGALRDICLPKCRHEAKRNMSATSFMSTMPITTIPTAS